MCIRDRDLIAQFLFTLGASKWVILLLINICLLFLGCFLSITSAILIATQMCIRDSPPPQPLSLNPAAIAALNTKDSPRFLFFILLSPSLLNGSSPSFQNHPDLHEIDPPSLFRRLVSRIENLCRQFRQPDPGLRRPSFRRGQKKILHFFRVSVDAFL